MSGKKNVLYEEIEKIRNNETGEIVEERNRKVVKRNTTPDFIMFFTQTSPQLAESKLTASQSTVLFKILTGQRVYRNNVVDLSSVARAEIERDTDLTRNTINMAISALCKKEIILREQVGKNTYSYMLNPYCFGKGNWADLEKLRYQVDITYDFKSLEVSHSEKTSSSYEGSGELQEHKHNVVGNNQYIDDKGVIHHEVEVEKDNDDDGTIDADVEKINPNQLSLPFDDNGSNQDNKNQKYQKLDPANDIELIKEQNKAKELSIKELELKIKAKELGIS